VGKGGGWLDERALNECFVLPWLAKEYSPALTGSSIVS
jgi:hypothetical protein